MEFRLRHEIVAHRGAGILQLTPEPESGQKDIVVLHGLGASKDMMLTKMYQIATKGFRVTSVDLFLHGDRSEAVYREQMLGSDFVTAVRDVIYETAADVPVICAELGIDVARSGIVGISTGGFAAHVLAIQRPQFKAMVAAISSPDWLKIDPSRTPHAGSPEGMLLAQASPVNHAPAYAPIAVCLLNAQYDEQVSPSGSQDLYNRLLPIYREQGIAARLDLTLYSEAGHYYDDDMLAKTVEWFQRFL